LLKGKRTIINLDENVLICNHNKKTLNTKHIR
jgi:hypothetical protein